VSSRSERGPFPDENLPEGSVVDGSQLSQAFEDEADYVVVGSGAAGAVAAHTLASAGHSVLICEEGPWVRTREFTEDIDSSFRNLLRDNGLQVLRGRAYMPMLQGRVVGGSTVVNSAIAWRMPEDVVEEWRRDFGLGDAISMKDLEPHYEALERDLGVHPVDETVLGENNRLFIETGTKRGFEPQAMRRYERECQGSSRCIQGCPNGAKQGMNVTYVPWTLGKGGRIVTDARVERVVVSGGRAVGVQARSKSGARILLRARLGVFVAASTVQTPNLLRRSGLRARALGENFQAHPGQGFGALFDKPVDMGFGATQGAESIHFRTSHRFKLETISMPPELATARVPGVGAELSKRLSQLGNVGVWVVQFRSEGKGRVGTTWGGADRVTFSPTAGDMERLRTAFAAIATMMFDAGAREVWPGIFGLPAVLSSHDDVKKLAEASLDPRAYSMVATHLFGAARMGPDPRTSVVGPDFQTHEVKDLHVVDSSVFPTNLGVNPQHAIMTLSRLAATRALERTGEIGVTRSGEVAVGAARRPGTAVA
jgi:choline dehydrogenase-like flavoprotein